MTQVQAGKANFPELKPLRPAQKNQPVPTYDFAAEETRKDNTIGVKLQAGGPLKIPSIVDGEAKISAQAGVVLDGFHYYDQFDAKADIGLLKIKERPALGAGVEVSHRSVPGKQSLSFTTLGGNLDAGITTGKKFYGATGEIKGTWDSFEATPPLKYKGAVGLGDSKYSLPISDFANLEKSGPSEGLSLLVFGSESKMTYRVGNAVSEKEAFVGLGLGYQQSSNFTFDYAKGTATGWRTTDLGVSLSKTGVAGSFNQLITYGPGVDIKGWSYDDKAGPPMAEALSSGRSPKEAMELGLARQHGDLRSDDAILANTHRQGSPAGHDAEKAIAAEAVHAAATEQSFDWSCVVKAGQARNDGDRRPALARIVDCHDDKVVNGSNVVEVELKTGGSAGVTPRGVPSAHGLTGIDVRDTLTPKEALEQMK